MVRRRLIGVALLGAWMCAQTARGQVAAAVPAPLPATRAEAAAGHLRVAGVEGPAHRRLARRLSARPHQGGVSRCRRDRHGVRAIIDAGRGSRSRRSRPMSRRFCRRRRERCSPTARRCDSVLDPATFTKVEAKVAATAMPHGPGRTHEAMAGLDAAGRAGAPRAGFDPAHGLDRHYLRPGHGRESTGAGPRDGGLPGRAAQRPAAAGPGRDAEGHARRRGGPGAVGGDDRHGVAHRRPGDTRPAPAPVLPRIAGRSTSGCSSSATATGFRRSRSAKPRRRPVCVVVGGAHLLGPDGLVALLGAAGFTLEQM